MTSRPDAPRGGIGTFPPAWFVEPSLGQRLGGAIVDGLVTAPLLFAAWLLFSDGVALALGPLLRAVYEVGLVARDGQTIGKRVARTRVVRFADGRVPAVDAAFLRWLVVVAPVLVGRVVPPVRPVGGLVMLAFLLPVLSAPYHRGLHDRAAGTVVTCA